MSDTRCPFVKNSALIFQRQVRQLKIYCNRLCRRKNRQSNGQYSRRVYLNTRRNTNFWTRQQIFGVIRKGDGGLIPPKDISNPPRILYRFVTKNVYCSSCNNYRMRILDHHYWDNTFDILFNDQGHDFDENAGGGGLELHTCSKKKKKTK